MALKWNLLIAILLPGLAGPALGGMVSQDNFTDEIIGNPPSQWTKLTPYGSFSVQDEGSPYGKVMYFGIWNGGSSGQGYAVESNAAFASEGWTIRFDVANWQQWCDWSYAEILRTPGNFVLAKDQHRAIQVYNGNGTLLGATNNSMDTVETWTHYVVEYRSGTLTVTASNVNGSTTGSFTGAVPDYAAHDKVTIGTFAAAGGSTYLKVDNVLVETPTTINIVDYAREVMRLDPDTLQDWQPVIQAAVQSNTKVLFPPGVYTIRNTIFLDHKSMFLLEGNGADIAWHPDNISTDAALLYTNYCYHARIQGLGFDGRCSDPGNSTSGNAHGVVIDHSHHITLRHCHVRNIGAIGIVLSQSNRCTVENNRIDQIGTCGIIAGKSSNFPDSADYCVIRENIIRKVYKTNGIFVTPDFGSLDTSQTVTGTIITGNVVDQSGDIGIESSLRCIGSVVANNVVTNSRNGAILALENRYSVVRGNYCDQPPNAGSDGAITVKRYAGLTEPNHMYDAYTLVEGNIAVRGLAGIKVEGVNWVAVKNNVVKDASDNGVGLTGASNCIVSGNTIHNQSSHGIGLYGTLTNVDIEDNRIEMTGSTSMGLVVDPLAPSSVTWTDCRIRNNNVFGTCGYSYRALPERPLQGVVNCAFAGNRYSMDRPPQGFDNFIDNEETVTCPGNVPWAYVICDSLYHREGSLVYIRAADNSEYCKFYIQPDGTCRALPATGNLGGTGDSKRWRLENVGTGDRVYGIKCTQSGIAAKAFTVKHVSSSVAAGTPYGSIEGRAVLYGFLGDHATVGLAFELAGAGGGGTIKRFVGLDSTGGFRLENIPAGGYDLTVRCPGWVSARQTLVVSDEQTTVLDTPIALRGADFNGDDAVGFEDFAILQNNYGRSGGSASPLAAAAAIGGCGVPGTLALLLILAIAGLADRKDR